MGVGVPLMLGIVGLVFLVLVWTKSFKTKGAMRNFVHVAGWILLVFGVLSISANMGLFDAEKLGLDNVLLATTGGAVPSTQTDNTNTNSNVNQQLPSTNRLVIATLKATAKEKNSNSYSNVGSGTGAGAEYLNVYDQTTNPASPTASYIDRINVTSGSGSSTAKKLTTGQPYRLAFEGSSIWYDKDFGVVNFANELYNIQTAELLFDMGDVVKIATIDDMITEFGGTDGNMNGETSNSSVHTLELYGVASDSIAYNVSAGDGQFYIEPKLSASGAYTELQNPVLCFERDASNPPEGNEITSITQQLVSGTDLGIPSELVDYWSVEQCVNLGSTMKGGASSEIKLTFTVEESNLASGADLWYLYFDDLGDIRGKDVTLSTGATYDRIQFDSVA